MTTQDSRIWFITGSSSGFGRALAETVLNHGETVVATARKPQRLQDLKTQYPSKILTLRLDITKPGEVREAVNQAIATFGRIDVLVNNAGYAVLGAIEEVSDVDIRRQFETNFFGTLDVTRAVLPHMRYQRSGYILNMSSAGGFVGFPGAGIYCSTKFALEGFSEALAKEVAPLGIKVTIVELGAFRTNFNDRSLIRPDQSIDDYTDTSGQMLKWIQDINGSEPGDPNKAAAAMIQAVDSVNPPLRLVLGADAVEAIFVKIEAMKVELDTWKAVAVNTTFSFDQW